MLFPRWIVMFTSLASAISITHITPLTDQGMDGPIQLDIVRSVSATSSYAKKLMNCNSASIAGVLGYIHTEVIPLDIISNCERHFSINRIAHHRVIVWNPPGKRPFGEFFAYDSGSCKATDCAKQYAQYGYFVGRQTEAGNPRHRYQTDAYWYSMPELGICDQPDGTKNCTYSYEFLGFTQLDDIDGLTALGGYSAWCNAGGIEFERQARTAPGCCETVDSRDYWWGPCDVDNCTKRVAFLTAMIIGSNSSSSGITSSSITSSTSSGISSSSGGLSSTGQSSMSSSESNSSSSSSPAPHKHLSKYQVVGIAVGSGLVVMGFGAAMWFCCCTRKGESGYQQM